MPDRAVAKSLPLGSLLMLVRIRQGESNDKEVVFPEQRLIFLVALKNELTQIPARGDILIEG